MCRSSATRLCLAALDEALDGTKREGDFGAVEARKREKFAKFEALARSDDSPIKPERVVYEMQKVLDRDAIVVADPGTPCPYFSAYYVVGRTGRRFFSNRAHGALGYSLAASIGAYFAKPKVKTVAVMGDGSFGMCVGELETAVRLKLPITFVVISNAVYGWIKAGQKSGYDRRYFSVDFGVTDHAKVAEAFGVKSWRVFEPGKLQEALKQAAAHAGPTLVDVVCQPLHRHGRRFGVDRVIERQHHDLGGRAAGKVERTEHDCSEFERRIDALAVILGTKKLLRSISAARISRRCRPSCTTA